MPQPINKRPSSNLNYIALLGAFSMFLSTIEYLFPRPLPFMRLGLANLPLLLGLELFSWPSYMLLVLIKVLGQALVNGTLASYIFLFSFCGTLASALIMWGCRRVLGRNISFVGISMLGALASNLIQITLSISFFFGDAAWRILPIFLGIGLVSGFLIGLFAEHFSIKSRWWRAFAYGDSIPLTEAGVSDAPGLFGKRTGEKAKKKPRKKRKDRLGLFLTPAFRFWVGICLIPPFLFIRELPVKFLLVVLFAVITVLSGKRIRFFYFLILISSIMFFHLLTPLGRIIGTIGPIQITLGALGTGLLKGLSLCGLVFISLFSVSGQLRLPGKLGGLLAYTFYYFEEILEGRGRIVPGKVISSLDTFLLELFPPGTLKTPEVAPPGGAAGQFSRVPGFFYFIILFGAVWGAFLRQLLV